MVQNFKTALYRGLSGTAQLSLYPGKNLGSIGDAGVANTDSEKSVNLKMIRNYEVKEVSSR